MMTNATTQPLPRVSRTMNAVACYRLKMTSNRPSLRTGKYTKGWYQHTDVCSNDPVIRSRKNALWLSSEVAAELATNCRAKGYVVEIVKA